MKKHFNYQLFFLVLFMTAFGALFLAILSAPSSLDQFGNTNYYLSHQLVRFLIACVLAFIAFKIPLRFFKKAAPFFLLANLVLLILVFLPFIGSTFWGARRWINIGVTSFQPSEFLKITAILYLATWISNRVSDKRKKDWKSLAKIGYYNLIYVFVPFVVFLSIISLILIFQPDISTLGIIGATLLVMYFCAKTPIWHTLTIAGFGTACLLLLVKFEPYRLDRWLVFLNPEADPLGKGFQLNQSLIAMGSGGIFGQGLGMSVQKFGFLPQAMSDSIFAIIGEELGIIGSIVLVCSFIWFAYLGFKIARDSSDKFSKLAATGITFWIIFQAIINLASVTGIFPLSGIPLPFFSYGGSHLLTELVGVGLLLNISKNAQ